MYAKKLTKIYKRIDKVASKGKDNKQEYFNLIDELLNRGDYVSFVETLLTFYEIDVSNYQTINRYKEESWKSICEKTESNFLKKLSSLYKSKGIYQISFNIYRESDNKLLGKIVEEDLLGEEANYYLKNKQYARLIGERKTYLRVSKENSEAILIDTDDLQVTEENNLFNRYKTAVEYLLS